MTKKNSILAVAFSLLVFFSACKKDENIDPTEKYGSNYIINYGSSKVLQVDPSATLEENFVKGEIDLSAYNFTGNSVPNMADAVIVNNQLFVALQRLGADWSYNQAYIAVIDLSTNEEVDTNPQQSGLKGIPLNAKNTSTITAHNGYIYAAGRGTMEVTQVD